MLVGRLPRVSRPGPSGASRTRICQVRYPPEQTNEEFRCTSTKVHPGNGLPRFRIDACMNSISMSESHKTNLQVIDWSFLDLLPALSIPLVMEIRGLQA